MARTSDELNAAIQEADGGVLATHLGADGAVLFPYAGWYWRTVDWDRVVTLADANAQYDYENMCSVPGKGGPHIVFCENNKWDYESHWIEDAGEIAKIRQATEAILDSTVVNLADNQRALRETLNAAWETVKEPAPSPSGEAG